MAGLVLRLLLALAFAGPVAAQDAPRLPDEPLRSVTGSVSLDPGLSMPADAVLVLTARGLRGAVLSEARRPVPSGVAGVGFTLQVPSGPRLTLSAALRLGDEDLLVSRPQVLPPGDAAITLPDLPLALPRPLVLPQELDCSGTRLRIAQSGADMVLDLPERRLILSPLPGTGALRFGDGAEAPTELVFDGPTLRLTLMGEALPDCIATPELDLYEAQGIGWGLTVEAGQFLLVRDGAPAQDGTVPEAQAEGTAALWDLGAAGLVRMEAVACADPGGGQPLPETVTITLPGGGVLDGCGGQPQETLADTLWTVVQLSGAVLTAAPELSFGGDGQLGGTAGCNRLTARWQATRDTLGLGDALASTRMACPPEVAATEAALLATLGATARFDIAPDGALELMDAQGTLLLRARR